MTRWLRALAVGWRAFRDELAPVAPVVDLTARLAAGGVAGAMGRHPSHRRPQFYDHETDR